MFIAPTSRVKNYAADHAAEQTSHKEALQWQLCVAACAAGRAAAHPGDGRRHATHPSTSSNTRRARNVLVQPPSQARRAIGNDARVARCSALTP
jgi:hypothetical protein